MDRCAPQTVLAPAPYCRLLGGEVYSQGADTKGGRRFTGLNLGVNWQVSPRWSLLASGGPGLQDARQRGLYGFYVALEETY